MVLHIIITRSANFDDLVRGALFPMTSNLMNIRSSQWKIVI